jgi:hypothetical protein
MILLIHCGHGKEMVELSITGDETCNEESFCTSYYISRPHLDEQTGYRRCYPRWAVKGSGLCSGCRSHIVGHMEKKIFPYRRATSTVPPCPSNACLPCSIQKPFLMSNVWRYIRFKSNILHQSHDFLRWDGRVGYGARLRFLNTTSWSRMWRGFESHSHHYRLLFKSGFREFLYLSALVV